MIKKSKFNKLLATVSTFALISGASSAAMGDQVTDDGGGDVVLGGNADANTAHAAKFKNNDSFYFSNAGHGLTTGGEITINAIDLNNQAPGQFVVAHNTSVGPITDTGGANTIDLIVNDGVTFTLENNAGVNAAGGVIAAGKFNGVGNIELGSGGAAGTLTINSNPTLAGTIDSNAHAADGIVNVNAGKAVTFNGVIGGTTGLAELNALGNGSKINLGADAKVTTVKVANAGAQVNINGGNLTGDISFTADGAVNVADTRTINGKVDSTVANKGVLNFAGISVVTAKVGETLALKEVNINGTTGAGAVDFQSEVKAQKITVNHAGAKVNFAGDVTAANGLQFSANGQATVANGKTITGNVTTAAPNTGNLVFEQAGGVVGTIGAKDLALKTVEVSAGAVALDGKAHYAKTFLFKDNAAQLTIADGGSLTGNAVANAAGNGVIEFTKSGTFTGTLGDDKNHLGAVIANGAGAVTIGAGNHRVGTFKAANAGSIFDFADGATLSTHAIDNTSGAVGATKLNFVGSGGVSGVVGGTNPFAEINLKGGKEAVVTFTNDTNATNFNIGAGTGVLDSTKADRTLAAEVKFTDIFNGKLLIKGANNATIDGAVAQVGNRGTVTIASDVANKNVTFNDVVGVAADANALKRLEIENGFTGQVQLDADTHITDVEINGGSIRLGANNYKFGGISGNGTLLVNADGATLMGPDAPDDAEINLGTADNRLAKLEFAADHTLSIGDGVNIHVDTLQFNANDQGKLAFEGTSIFEANATGGGNGKLNTITLDDKAYVTILSPDTVVNGLTALGNNSTLTIAGKFNANGGLQGANDAAGTLRFVNGATITGNVGAAGKSLACIEFAGSDVEFTGDVVHKAGQAFVFSGDTASTVKFNNKTNIGDNVFTNNSDANITHTIVLTKAGVTEFTQNLATSVDKQLNFQLAAGVNAKITGGDATGTNFVSANKGELELANAGTVINSAGDFSKSFGKVVFSESATINNNTYAGELKVNAGKTATLGGIIQSGNFHLAAAGSTVSFLDDAIVNSVIKTDVPDQGAVIFTGGAAINENLGEQAKVWIQLLLLMMLKKQLNLVLIFLQKILQCNKVLFS